MDIKAIIDQCADKGRLGAQRISDESQDTKWPVAVKTVYGWVRYGIPQWHWDLVASLSGVGINDIYQANRAIEQQRDTVPARPTNQSPTANAAA